MSVDQSPVDHPVTAHAQRFVAALRAHDAEAACSVYASDAHLLPPTADAVHGRSEICCYWQAGLDSGMTDIAFDRRALREHDGIAYEFGRYTLRLEPIDGKPVVERGHYVQIHAMTTGGAWERVVEIFSPGGGE